MVVTIYLKHQTYKKPIKYILMKQSKTLIALTLAGMVLASCGGSSKNNVADSTASSAATDTVSVADSGSVKPADSTRSFRNDRGTDSVSAGKSVPAQP